MKFEDFGKVMSAVSRMEQWERLLSRLTHGKLSTQELLELCEDMEIPVPDMRLLLIEAVDMKREEALAELKALGVTECEGKLATKIEVGRP